MTRTGRVRTGSAAATPYGRGLRTKRPDATTEHSDMTDTAAIAELSRFQMLDWGIVACWLAVSLLIGLFVTRYATSMTSYIGAGRSVGPWLG